MKSFKDYLTESKKTYDFKVKIAGDCPKDCVKKIKEVEDVVYYGTVDVWHDDADQYFEEVNKIRKEYGEKKRPS
jgi:dissimilatory sulfite reductase (desulfoviridin) alpha/beta subunit